MRDVEYVGQWGASDSDADQSEDGRGWHLATDASGDMARVESSRVKGFLDRWITIILLLLVFKNRMNSYNAGVSFGHEL